MRRPADYLLTFCLLITAGKTIRFRGLVIASEAKQSKKYDTELDCFVATAPRNDYHE